MSLRAVRLSEPIVNEGCVVNLPYCAAPAALRPDDGCLESQLGKVWAHG